MNLVWRVRNVDNMGYEDKEMFFKDEDFAMQEFRNRIATAKLHDNILADEDIEGGKNFQVHSEKSSKVICTVHFFYMCNHEVEEYDECTYTIEVQPLQVW